MSPLAAVAVAGAIGIGLYEVIKEPSSVRTLEYMNGEDLGGRPIARPIVRVSNARCSNQVA